MRSRITAAVLVLLFLLAIAGCSKSKNNKDERHPSYTEKYLTVSETDIFGRYAIPFIKNLSDENAQNKINEEISGCLSEAETKLRIEKAEKSISNSDISEYKCSEIGTYKVHCNDGKYISCSVSIEQTFSDDDDDFETFKHNYIFNYDAETGKKIDLSILFEDKKQVSEYIAHKLYERLLSMDCLVSDNYSDEIFKKDVLNYCVIVTANNKIAVVTTSGEFGLKSDAGAPIIEISIPEEYYV